LADAPLMTHQNNQSCVWRLMMLSAKYGLYGGQYVPETLMPALGELTRAYQSVREEEEFQAEYRPLLNT
jgi:tryptophan synthase beta chain